MYATEDGGHETLKAAAVLNLGVVIFPAIVPAIAPVSASLAHGAPNGNSPVKAGVRSSSRCLQFFFSLQLNLCVCI